MNVYCSRLVISMQHAPTQKDLFTVRVIRDTLEMGIHVKVSQTRLFEKEICFYLPFQHVYSEGAVFMSGLTRLICVTQICIILK